MAAPVNTVRTTSECVVRRAAEMDEELLLHWRNEPWVVALGASQRTVTAAEHHLWFAETLRQKERELFLIEIGGKPAGMVRYDLGANDTAEISIYLMPPFPGKGHGRTAFLETTPSIFTRRKVHTITARVLSGNERSLEFFRRFGFVSVSTTSGIHNLALVRPAVQHSRPFVGKEEQDAALAVVASRNLAQGEKVLELERRWCERTGTAAAAAVSSGLSALRLALVALGVGAGNEVIMPAYSCVALLNAALAVGANPVLADVNEGEWMLSPADVRHRITKRTKAIIAVHLFGMPVDMEKLSRFGVPVIEDCAHGIGGRTGTAEFGNAGAVSIASFYATKMLCAGEGGILASNDGALVARVRQARDYGDQLSSPYHLNDKMTDLEAALALVQLDKLETMLTARAERARRYSEWLAPLAGRELTLPEDVPGRIWYRYAVRLQRQRAAEIVERMQTHGVRAEQPVWDLRADKHWNDGLKTTALAFDRVLSLPLYPDLSEFEQRMVCAALEAALES